MTPLMRVRCVLWRIRWPLVALAASLCVGEALTVVFGPSPVLTSGPELPRASRPLEAGRTLTTGDVETNHRHTTDKRVKPRAGSDETAASLEVVGKRLIVPVDKGEFVTRSMVSDVPHKLSSAEGLVTVSLPASTSPLARPGAIVQVLHNSPKSAIRSASAATASQPNPVLVLSKRAVIVSILDAGSKGGPSWNNGSTAQIHVLLRASITEAKQIATAAQVSPISVIFVT